MCQENAEIYSKLPWYCESCAKKLIAYREECWHWSENFVVNYLITRLEVRKAELEASPEL